MDYTWLSNETEEDLEELEVALYSQIHFDAVTENVATSSSTKYAPDLDYVPPSFQVKVRNYLRKKTEDSKVNKVLSDKPSVYDLDFISLSSVADIKDSNGNDNNSSEHCAVNKVEAEKLPICNLDFISLSTDAGIKASTGSDNDGCDNKDTNPEDDRPEQLAVISSKLDKASYKCDSLSQRSAGANEAETPNSEDVYKDETLQEERTEAAPDHSLVVVSSSDSDNEDSANKQENKVSDPSVISYDSHSPSRIVVSDSDPEEKTPPTTVVLKYCHDSDGSNSDNNNESEKGDQIALKNEEHEDCGTESERDDSDDDTDGKTHTTLKTVKTMHTNLDDSHSPSRIVVSDSDSDPEEKTPPTTVVLKYYRDSDGSNSDNDNKTEKGDRVVEKNKEHEDSGTESERDDSDNDNDGKTHSTLKTVKTMHTNLDAEVDSEREEKTQVREDLTDEESIDEENDEDGSLETGCEDSSVAADAVSAADNMKGGASSSAIIANSDETKKKWVVDEKDLLVCKTQKNRYFNPNTVICRNCKEEGHLALFCTKEKKVVCIFCGMQGHRHLDCPQAVCFKCCSPGHKPANCTDARRNRYIECYRCWLKGHLGKACPDLWRQYHQTIGFNSDRIVEPQGQVNERVYCYNCGHKGHYGYECDSVRMSPYLYPCYPFVAEYDKGRIQRDEYCRRENHKDEGDDSYSRKRKYREMEDDEDDFYHDNSHHRRDKHKETWNHRSYRREYSSHTKENFKQRDDNSAHRKGKHKDYRESSSHRYETHQEKQINSVHDKKKHYERHDKGSYAKEKHIIFDDDSFYESKTHKEMQKYSSHEKKKHNEKHDRGSHERKKTHGSPGKQNNRENKSESYIDSSHQRKVEHRSRGKEDNVDKKRNQSSDMADKNKNNNSSSGRKGHNEKQQGTESGKKRKAKEYEATKRLVSKRIKPDDVVINSIEDLRIQVHLDKSLPSVASSSTSSASKKKKKGKKKKKEEHLPETFFTGSSQFIYQKPTQSKYAEIEDGEIEDSPDDVLIESFKPSAKSRSRRHAKRPLSPISFIGLMD